MDLLSSPVSSMEVSYGKPSFESTQFGDKNTSEEDSPGGNNGGGIAHCSSSSPATPYLHEQDPVVVASEKATFYQALYERTVGQDPSAMQRIHRRTVTTANHTVPVTIYMPPNNNNDNDNDDNNDNDNKQPIQLRGVCLHVHGGGWLYGDSQHQVAARMLEMAQQLHVAVVSVEYRLTPTHGHPHPVHDVVAVAQWLQQCAPTEFGTSVLVASGESAGAHLLTLATLQLLREQDQSQPSLFQCLNLVYGVYDLSGTPSVLADGNASSPLSGNTLQWFIDLYLSSNKNHPNRKDPTVSPLYANLRGMPPALFTIGDADPLLDDTLFMVQRYGAAGSRAELAVYHGGVHGIGHFGLQENTPLGKRARQYTLDFLSKHL